MTKSLLLALAITAGALQPANAGCFLGFIFGCHYPHHYRPHVRHHYKAHVWRVKRVVERKKPHHHHVATPVKDLPDHSPIDLIR